MNIATEGPTPGYRPCVGLALFNGKGEVFIGRRNDRPADDPYAWQLPQGGIDDGETPREAALRELAEETGVTSAEVLAESTGWFDYDFPADIAASRWSGRFRGQTQKWFALRLAGDDGEINIATEHQEFDAWRWAALESVPALAVAFKRPLYERVADAFRHLVDGPDDLEIEDPA